jgi:hypothetical protein
MEITRYSKQDAVRFDREWRAALRAAPRTRRRLGPAPARSTSQTARVGLRFAQDHGTASGAVTFLEGEPVPHPSELCEQLDLDSAWFFPDGYGWAVHTEHEDWELAEVVEEAADGSR